MPGQLQAEVTGLEHCVERKTSSEQTEREERHRSCIKQIPRTKLYFASQYHTAMQRMLLVGFMGILSVRLDTLVLYQNDYTHRSSSNQRCMPA